MKTHLKFNFLLCSALALAWPLGVVASEIYHWVDADGVSHYSQSPPPAAPSEVKTLQVDGSQPASYDPEKDIYDVAGQEAAMQEMRDQMAESRKNRQKAEPSSSQNTVIYYPETYDGYNQVLYPPGSYRPRPPNGGNRPRPPDDDRPGRPTNLPAVTAPASRPFRPR